MPVTGDGLSFLSSFSFSESIIRWFWRLSHADAQERRSFYSAQFIPHLCIRLLFPLCRGIACGSAWLF